MEILLVEDNTTITKGLEYAFQTNGYTFYSAETVRSAKQFLEKLSIDLIVLDIGLPDGSGMKFYEEYIGVRQIPTIFLTAIDEEETIVTGLNLGADDYITKPFSTKELLARVNRVLMRNKKSSVIQIQEIVFDMDKMVVLRNGEQLNLTSLELKILHLLFLNINKAVSRNTILDKIWEWTGNDVDDHTVTVYLQRIRQKVGNKLITTVKGIGYRIDKDGK